MSVTTRGVLPPILLIGCGRMGSAMLAGWREIGLAPSVIVDPVPPDAALLAGGTVCVGSERDVPGDFVPQIVVAAIKPQLADTILPAFIRFTRSALVLSIMAGRTIPGLHEMLGASTALVRAMPNTPAAVRQGVTVAYAGPGVSPVQHTLCDALLQAIGLVAWVDNEDLLNPVTAVSGGGPAYVFLLAELLEQAAIAEGIPADLARVLTRRTISGSGALLEASDEESSALRRAVTSPKGTTERALAVLMADGAWPNLVGRAIGAATARSRELAR